MASGDEQRTSRCGAAIHLTTADVDQAMIDIEQIVAQAVDTDSIAVSRAIPSDSTCLSAIGL